MTDTISKVREFHIAFDQPVEPAPTVARPAFTECAELRHAATNMRAILRALRSECRSMPALRVGLILEELAELTTALADGDAVETLDALVDLRYVCDGTVLSHGMQGVFDEAFERVHASNLAKAGGGRDANGKIVKPAGWVKPQLRDLVAK